MLNRVFINCILFASATLVTIATGGSSMGATDEPQVAVQKQENAKKKTNKKVASQNLLPATTKAWVSIPDISKLDEKFLKTQLGQLCTDEQLKPFIKSIRGQFQNWMNERNVRLGVKMENVRAIQSGEICLAGILSPGAGNANGLGRGSHGLVFLVDISKTEEKAVELLTQIEKEMKAHGATKSEEDLEIHGAKINKWKLKRRNRLKKPKFAYQTISNGWLLASDNENIFRELLRRISFIDQLKESETLAAQKAFKNVAENTRFHEDKIDAEVRWFVDPFGYVELAKAIADEEQEFKQRSNDWMGVLKKVGFDAIQGVGGSVALATEKHEMLHRSFVFMPNDNAAPGKQSVFGLFDFENRQKANLLPPVFVPNDSSGYFSGTWDMTKALKNAGHVVDAFLKDPGQFEKLLQELSHHMNVNVKEVMKRFANEIIVTSESKLPASEESEHVLVAIKLNGDAKFVFDNISRAWPEDDKIKIAGFDAIMIDKETEEEIDDGLFGDPGFEDEDEEETDQDDQFNLFEKRFIVVKDDYLFLTNNQQYMEELLLKKRESELRNAEDFVRVTDALKQLSKEERVSFRQFSRIDRVLRTNYEMIRQGKMGASQTVLARLLNQAFTPPNANNVEPRDQKIDGSKLPEDYEVVARYMGPSGWVMETTKDGWLATGCVLKKKSPRETIANKADKPALIRND